MKSIEIIVSGRVQGVSFRYFTVQQANLYQILGNVRNTPDGKVKIIAVGDEGNMESFIEAVKQGPRLSRVEDIHISPLKSHQDFTNFRIEY
ncbi:MAG: acylphosphatase [Candidatus Cloacimonetes bacterium]|nr:acylphosphatase [Candidatus Cloacimonadota bacterium]MCF7813833.1 acylphosphatase [Candidatus Cloacimonadota bacterium]MCF7868271.1 acylphosphatase [Candidatus Cloacimonadota bacterium]MCF7883755.1 acylphosphatase [Candidatus Cloacimonadota bacterium]